MALLPTRSVQDPSPSVSCTAQAAPSDSCTPSAPLLYAGMGATPRIDLRRRSLVIATQIQRENWGRVLVDRLIDNLSTQPLVM